MKAGGQVPCDTHCIVQFFEVGFCFPFQPELLIDKVHPFLLFLGQFYLCLFELLYCQVLSLSFSSGVILGEPQKLVGTADGS